MAEVGGRRGSVVSSPPSRSREAGELAQGGVYFRVSFQRCGRAKLLDHCSTAAPGAVESAVTSRFLPLCAARTW